VPLAALSARPVAARPVFKYSWLRIASRCRFERIAVALLDLAEKFGVPDARGTIINLRFGHRNIAELVNGSRPKVCVCLRRFALEGVLIQERRRIIVVPGR
jgi:CRP-like cAMP-binding protein